MSFKLFLLLFLLLSLIKAQPISGEANKLEFRKDRIIYIGNVRLSRGEAVLKADRVIIFLTEDGKPVKLVAEGNVYYEEGEKRAFSQYAEYDFKNEIIYLKGNARVEEGKNVLEADEIVYDRKNNTLRAEGEGKKVKTIYIEEEEDEKIGHSEEDSKGKEHIPE